MNSTTWDTTKARFNSGDTVVAQIVEKKPFGLLVMIDHDVPGVIERIGLFDNGYESLDEFTVGSTVEANIIGFRDWSEQVELQLPERIQE